MKAMGTPMNRVKIPIFLCDRQGKIVYKNNVAKHQIASPRCGVNIFDYMVDDNQGKDSICRYRMLIAHAEDLPESTPVSIFEIRTRTNFRRALVGIYRTNGEIYTLWLLTSSLQINGINTLYNSIMEAHLAAGSDIISILSDEKLYRQPLSGKSSAYTGSSRDLRLESIDQKLRKIIDNVSRHGEEQLGNVKYGTRRSLSLITKAINELFPESGFFVDIDTTALPQVPDVETEFLPLATVIFRMFVLSAEISGQQKIKASYRMDDLDLVVSAVTTIKPSRFHVERETNMAPLGKRYPDRYPELLLISRLCELHDWEMSYTVRKNDEDNFEIRLAIELPDPFVCFIRSPKFEDNYDAEFLEYLSLISFNR